MKEIYFNTKDLAVGYKGKILIRDIDIQIKKGEILTLIGPNGSGKSTILKSITKHLTAIRGDTFIADASVAHMNYKELSKLVAVVLRPPETWTDDVRGRRVYRPVSIYGKPGHTL
ncbi:MAG: ATP-binding cassette domain-containing protein [Oscillospiraceae bacterium]